MSKEEFIQIFLQAQNKRQKQEEEKANGKATKRSCS